MIEEEKKTNRRKRIKPRTRYTKTQRDQHVADYHASGLTQQQYAEKAGVKYQTFVNWVHRKNRAEEAPVKKSWWLCLWPWGSR